MSVKIIAIFGTVSFVPLLARYCLVKAECAAPYACSTCHARDGSWETIIFSMYVSWKSKNHEHVTVLGGTIVSLLASTSKVINYFEKGANVVILSAELICDGVANLK